MTDKEIEALAKSFAEEKCPDSNYNKNTFNHQFEDRMNFQAGFERVVTWLSDRFDIVAKDKVREAISNIRDAYDNGDNDMVDAYLEELDLLFQQTLKSEENE